MSNRFHNKFHRQNHHSNPTPGYPDSAMDPIASFEQPFKGEFYSQGDIITTENLSAKKYVYADDGVIHNDLTVKGNFTVLGTTSQLDTLVYTTSAVNITNAGTGPALTVTQTGSNPIAHFIDSNGDDIVFADNGFVGLGVASPSEKLTISGNLSSSGTATIGTIATGAVNSVLIESTGLVQKRDINPQVWDTSAKYISASDGALSVNYLPKATNSNGVNESIIYDDGTNIGIGETSPEGKLHVKAGSSGTVTSQPNSVGIFENSGNSYISVLSPNAQYAGLVMGGPGNPYGSYVSWNHDNNALKVATAHFGGAIQLLVNTEQEAVRILSGGNVGIGTINPKEKLTINGNLSSSGTATIGTIATNDANTSFVVESNGLLQKRTLNVAAGNTTATFVSASDGALSVNYLTKATDSNGINESIISDNGSLVYVGGNVTISGNLTALGDSYFANTLFTTTTSISVVNYGTGPAIYAFQSSGNQDIASFYDGDGVEVLHVGNCPPGELYGKVGVNESDPNKELTVKGSVSASGTLNVGTINTNATSDSIVVLGANNVLEKRSIDSRAWGSSLVDGTGTADYVAKWSDADTITNSQIFDNGTNVGVGTTSPQGKLHIEGGSVNDAVPELFIGGSSGWTQFHNSAAQGNYNPLVQAGDKGIIYSSGIQDGTSGMVIGPHSASSKGIRISSDGATTIGTINTGTTDSVIIESSGTLQKRTIDSRAWGSSLVDGTGTANRVAYWIDSNTISADSNFFFDGTNVGIGTTSPGTGVKLDVNGVIRSATNTVTPAATTALPSSNDVILNNQTGPVTITAFSGGVAGVTYTLTNKSTHAVTLDTSASLFVRGGNSWASHKCTTNTEGYIVLPQNFSCSLRMDSITTGSAW